MSYYKVCNDDTLKPGNKGSSSIALKVGTERTLSFSNYLPNTYYPNHFLVFSKLLLGNKANHCTKRLYKECRVLPTHQTSIKRIPEEQRLCKVICDISVTCIPRCTWVTDKGKDGHDNCLTVNSIDSHTMPFSIKPITVICECECEWVSEWVSVCVCVCVCVLCVCMGGERGRSQNVCVECLIPRPLIPLGSPYQTSGYVDGCMGFSRSQFTKHTVNWEIFVVEKFS